MRARSALLIIIIVAILTALIVYLSLNLQDKETGASQGGEEGKQTTVKVEENPGKTENPNAIGNDEKNSLQAKQTETPLPVHPEVVVAWQPSHQDDTGDASWHEYLICGDIVDKAMRLCTAVNNVKCWDLSHGLTGTNNYRPQPTNTVAFDVEVSMANQARADYFISIHNDGGAPSGILGLCMPNDPISRGYTERFVNALCARTGLPKRGVWEVRLYSLEPERNKCPVRLLLEIGDNQRDRDLLESEQFRLLVAQALADVVNTLPDQR